MAECTDGVESCCLHAGMLKTKDEDIAATGTNAKCTAVEYITTGAGNKTRTLLLAAEWPDREKMFMKVDGGAGWCDIAAGGAETIRGAASVRLANQYDFVKVKARGNLVQVTGGNV